VNVNIQPPAKFVFLVFEKVVLLEVVYPLKIVSIQHFIVPL